MIVTKERETWEGYYTRKTKTKREKEIQQERKKKQKMRYLEEIDY